MEFYVEKKEQKTAGYKTKNLGGLLSLRPPLAEFGPDGARSFADDTTSVRGTEVRPRGCRWRSGAEGRQRGILGTSILGKSDLDITTTLI